MTVTLQKKVCMLGGFSVGKTSLVKRYVDSVFSETYLTTVGVKIDKKTVDLSDRIVNLILWDLAGEDDIASLRMSYLRGTAGYVLVADGTRPSTIGDEEVEGLRQNGWWVQSTSARTGEGVEEAFRTLADRVVR
jgi:GTPase SAR1 family protein